MNYRAATKRLGRLFRSILPVRKFDNYLFIAGAQKAGTSSLYFYLAKHPSVAGGHTKELHFFNRDTSFSKGQKYYQSQFPLFSRAVYALDATPAYMYSERAAERIHNFAPNAKFVMLLREPVSRAFSAYNMYRQLVCTKEMLRYLEMSNEDSKSFFLPMIERKVEPTIERFLDWEFEAINGGKSGDESALIRRGIYAPQLARYFELFGRENVLVLFSDDLSREPERVTNQVFEFIGLTPLAGQEYPKKHVREYGVEPAAKEMIRLRAGALFEQDKCDLKDQFGINVPW